ncbi:Transcriptional regulator STP2 [Meyerozyma sp. JA9]|nr:Transcriptional regulator STP2 [Meyerozyma sp. JA9]
MSPSKLLARAQTVLNAMLPASLASACSMLVQLVIVVLNPYLLDDKLVNENEKPQESKIFPTIRNQPIENSPNSSNPQQCSTGLTTRLLPFKNKKGEIEWAFTDDEPDSDELDVFKIPSGEKNDRFGSSSANDDVPCKEELSPTVSNSSNSDSILSADKKHKVKEEEETPGTLPSSPESSHEKDGENVLYHCPDCDRTFKMKGYLTRHMKKHAQTKAYHCPFHEASIYIDEANVTHRCHPTGDFSRRDTYKTHLKSRHFVYPDGIRAKDRHASAGRCSMCGEHFENSELWTEIHIEGAECRYLPTGFTGKSRIKRRIDRELRQANKDKDKALQNGTPTSSVAASTPQTAGFTESPSSVISSVPSGVSHLHMRDLSSGSPSYYPARSVSPLQHSFIAHSAMPQDDGEEYDDEYCLDVDQLDVPRDWFLHHGRQAQHA